MAQHGFLPLSTNRVGKDIPNFADRALHMQCCNETEAWPMLLRTLAAVCLTLGGATGCGMFGAPLVHNWKELALTAFSGLKSEDRFLAMRQEMLDFYRML